MTLPELSQQERTAITFFGVSVITGKMVVLLQETCVVVCCNQI